MTAQRTGETIDVTPTWAGIIPALLHLIWQREPKEAYNDAKGEIEKMARIADRYVVLAKRAGGVINLEQAVDEYVARAEEAAR